jgi:periplasmic protein TonB
MRCFFLYGLFLFVCLNLLAQKNKKSEEEYVTFTKVETEAGPDMKAWTAYLKKASVHPDSMAASIPACVYKVTVQFIVDKEGNIAEARAKSNPGYGLARKAEKIILRYEGIWRPANQCGRNVKSYKEQVVEFVVGG